MESTWLDTCRLWFVTDREYTDPGTLISTAQQALLGGADALVCRLKQDQPAKTWAIAEELRALCSELDKPFVISHSVELYYLIHADALHLGVGDQPLPIVRNQLGSAAVIGCSTHGIEEAAACLSSGADYVFLGPIFSTPSKLRYGPPLGIQVVHEANDLPGPVVFIGGINQANVHEITAAGGSRIAAISALHNAPSPYAAAQQLRQELELNDRSL